MEEKLKNFINTYTSQVSKEKSKKISNHFLAITSLKKFSKGEHIINYGEPNSKFYFLISGIVGSFVKTKKNDLFIRTLYAGGSPFAPLTTLIKKKTNSDANYICLSECEVFEGDFDIFLELKENNQELEFIYKKFLEEVYLRSEKRIDELSLLSCTERYIKLNVEIPDIISILPQYQIANYLNISPVQLSRIRKKISI